MHARKGQSIRFFAIKVIKRTTGETVGHFPLEYSRVTKYLMDRGARFTVTLTSSKYCVSPLVQGGLEIPCKVVIYQPRTRKNKQLVDMYEFLIEPQIYPRPESFVVGSFLETEETAKRRCVDEEMFRPAEGHKIIFSTNRKAPNRKTPRCAQPC